MDKYDVPSLIPPMLALLLASFCVVVSRIERLPDEVRVLFVLFAGVLGFIGTAMLWNWLAYRGAIWIKDFRSAWNAPTLRLVEGVKGMTHEQLATLGMISPVSMYIRVAEDQVSYWLHTRMGDIPMGWVVDYLEQNMVSYPDFLVQHGKPDALNRQYIRWFTDLMVVNGWADGAAGNKPAQWRIPLAEVGRRLGISDE